jgi:hypothetical protein
MLALNAVGKSTLIVGTILAVFTTICVIVRFQARRINRLSLGPDDWMILVALFAYYGFLADVFYGMFTCFMEFHAQVF